jgi:hypothetical protein
VTYCFQSCVQIQLLPLHIGLKRGMTLAEAMAVAERGQGLTLVHFLGQPETFLTLKLHETTQRIPQKALMMSRKVDECKPLSVARP